MKKTAFASLALVMLLFSCTKVSTTENDLSATDNSIIKRKCASNDVLEEQLKADPTLRDRMNKIEEFTKRSLTRTLRFRLVNGVIEIPVVVNVLYKTTAENISLAQIQSQIDVLNEDFNNQNADRTKVPAEFSSVDATVGVRFVLASVVRKSTTKKSWGTNDAMKKSSQGGINPTDPTHNLNIWSCNLGNGILGYAQFPGGNLATDGVVILYSAFGRTGTLIPTYNKGRTATHEVGHWMNLRHIWGDASCGNDLVDDTPVAATANYGCPSYPKLTTCTGKKAEMTMNYMDYTDDACMYMFTNGQKSRMLAIFAAGGPRAVMGQ
ncbi:zinc metalloprotease [Ferruginibacter lapsinanis]|uniref:zinc metalloprotease n=1 Tax=Ferruginibacter lapsinanis TaxID=563172 RepID=UPI001E61F786|nr:zinc metalloprotease [Ferruginibacter lapsinanis]UEG50385.1 zinc metalloprotease [Ferruginibacter lapsinanis]